ncbi:MAG: hypothetical protein NVV59_08810 [Chitinophagaceae bacterium]|nr:hypothetical protein [Chitinophagaceae bacterium]
MKTYSLILLLVIPFVAPAQHYFNELLEAKSIEQRMKVLLDQKVETVTATGFDERGARSRDFNEWQQVHPSTRTWLVQTRNGLSISRTAYRFNTAGRLLSITDSANGVTSLTEYKYDPQNRISEVLINVKDSAQEFSQTESHQWSYDASGSPTRFLRIVDKKDTTEFRLTKDEKGRVADEQLFRRNTGLDQLYYYYNSQDQITDIVRYNKRLKKLLPDFMFEYDEQGRVIQKIATVSTRSSDYIIWRYAYNEHGLKTREALFNKQKEMTGRIEYAYTFLP